jgi:hypothetical protein
MTEQAKQEPCNSANIFMRKNDCKSFRFIEKKEFDNLCKEKKFVAGPAIETFGDGYGEPYVPIRQIFGKLADGTCLITETS